MSSPLGTAKGAGFVIFSLWMGLSRMGDITLGIDEKPELSLGAWFVAIIGTVAGVMTSLGLGVQQVSAGLVHVGVFKNPSNLLLVGLLAVLVLRETCVILREQVQNLGGLVPTFVTFLWFSVLGDRAVFGQISAKGLLGPDSKVVGQNVWFDMLASGGNPNPPKWSRVLLASLSGLVAIALLLRGQNRQRQEQLTRGVQGEVT